MKIALVAAGMLVTLATLGLACGPKETFCYEEGLPCREIVQPPPRTDAGSDADRQGSCFDNLGVEIPCRD